MDKQDPIDPPEDQPRLVALLMARSPDYPNRARNIRQSRGLSQCDLASSIGVDPSTLCRWERGERRPTGQAAIRWVECSEALAGEEWAR